MKTSLIALGALALMLGIQAPAQAAGCLKGAAIGGVAGHVAGHHGLLGAGAGCIVGRHNANKSAREADQARTTNTNANSNTNTTDR